MQITMSPISPKDREPIMDIFNYYVEHSFAAYPEKKLPYEFFDTFLRMCEGYPSATVRDEAGKVAGFGMLRPYSPIPAFSKTAEITYFLEPMCTGRGIGTIILDHLIVRGGEKGLTSLLASISSLNEKSIRFHLKNGFVECGRFRKIGLKKSQTFDIVYYQKML